MLLLSTGVRSVGYEYVCWHNAQRAYDARRKENKSARASDHSDGDRRRLDSATEHRALGEAITALRRGDPVLIRDHHVGALAVAAELVTKENLRRRGAA